MSNIEKYKENKKKQKFHTAMFMLFWIPALLLAFMPENEPFYITLPLKFAGLVFIYLSYKYSLCPDCNKSPGWGWNIEKCKACGEKLV